MYKERQLRLHAPGHDAYFAALLQQLGISSFIRLSGSHYNTPREIECFLRATAAFADHVDRSSVGAGRGASLAG